MEKKSHKGLWTIFKILLIILSFVLGFLISKMIPDTYMTYIYYETGNLKVLDPVEHNIYL